MTTADRLSAADWARVSGEPVRARDVPGPWLLLLPQLAVDANTDFATALVHESRCIHCPGLDSGHNGGLCRGCAEAMVRQLARLIR